MDGASVKIERTSRLLPALVGVLLVLQLAAPYRGWLALLVGLGAGWLVSYWWAATLARRLRLRRKLRLEWASVGDRLEETFTLSNNGWARGVWVEVAAGSTLPDYRPGRITGADAHTTVQWRAEGVCLKRGLFTLGPTHLHTADPLGLYTVSQTYPQVTTMIVTPRIVSLPAIEVAPGGRAGQGRPRANAPEPTVSAAGVRDYTPGDSLHRVHWPTSARRQTLSVRLFDSTPAGDWWIFLDLEQQAQAGRGDESTEEHGIILAASLADRGLRRRRAVGLVACGQELVWLPPRPGEEQRWRILRSLALLEPGDQPLSALLSRARPAFGQLASLIIITPAAGNWVETLPLLLRRGVVPTVLFLDPAAFGGEESAAAVTAILKKLKVAHYRITPQLLNRPEQTEYNASDGNSEH